MNRLELFPALEPFRKDYLAVGDGHELYFEESGNPKGQPVVFLHGGPGSNTEPIHRRFFNPQHYRIILFDQRGSGKSRPFASLDHNTTWHLVADMERLREHLKISQWMVFGGSWGSTLGLTYAISHPKRVEALFLRGIFLCTRSDIHWFYQHGTHFLFPEEWEKYTSVIPAPERSDMVAAYYRRLTSADKKVQLEAAKAWSRWEGATISLAVSEADLEHFTADDHALSVARIECHYFINNCFFDRDNWILENIGKIQHIPGVIVHGRYDVICPPQNAWQLHKLWAKSELHIIPDAGHTVREPGIIDALVRATNAYC